MVMLSGFQEFLTLRGRRRVRPGLVVLLVTVGHLDEGWGHENV